MTELEKRVPGEEPGENSAVASGQRSEFPDWHLFRPGQRGAVRIFKGFCSLDPAILRQQSVSFWAAGGESVQTVCIRRSFFCESYRNAQTLRCAQDGTFAYDWKVCAS